MVMRPLRWVVAVVLAAVASALWAPAAYAAGSAGLTVAVTGPTTAPSGSTFSYTILIRDLGPDAADGATFEVAPPSGSSAIAATCAAAGGAACPAAVAVVPGSVAGTLPTLPVNGSVTLVMTGQYGSGTSATVTATVAVPAGFVDPNPATNTSTHTTVLTPRAADVAVTTSLDAASADFGQTVTYTTAVTNNGADDLVGLHLDNRFHSVRVGPQNGLSVTGSLSCDPLAASAAPCPTSLAAPVPYTGSLNGSDLSIAWPPVDLPAGTTLYLKVRVAFATSHCATLETRQVESVVHLVAPTGLSLAGTPSAVSPPITLEGCTDAAVHVAMSDPAPHAGQAVTTTVTVSNPVGGALSDVPFVIQLPDHRGLAVDLVRVPPACRLGSVVVGCPKDLAYDLVAGTIHGTIAGLAGGETFSVSLSGTAGVLPSTSYATSATIRVGLSSSSTSTVAYTITNSRAKISTSVALQGGVSSQPLVFTGTVTCAQQGKFPFTVTIPAGKSHGTVTIGSSVWGGDVCTAAITSIPAAPSGYAWAGRGTTQTGVSSFIGVRAGAFTFIVRPVPSAPVMKSSSTDGVAATTPTAADTTSAVDADTSPTVQSAKDVVLIVTGTTDSAHDWRVGAVGALVMLVGLGLAKGRF